MADLWDDEDRYWRQNYTSRPYAKGSDYDTLAPGYRYGYESATKHHGRAWNDVESDLERDWTPTVTEERARGSRSRRRYAMPGIASQAGEGHGRSR